jgi:hypothetical protein
MLTSSMECRYSRYCGEWGKRSHSYTVSVDCHWQASPGLEELRNCRIFFLPLIVIIVSIMYRVSGCWVHWIFIRFGDSGTNELMLLEKMGISTGGWYFAHGY